MTGPGRIPTDAEIREAARLLWDGGFNGKDPEKAVCANRLVAEAGDQRGWVASRIMYAAADLQQEASDDQT
jgi:hypothetical protein